MPFFLDLDGLSCPACAFHITYLHATVKTRRPLRGAANYGSELSTVAKFGHRFDVSILNKSRIHLHVVFLAIVVAFDLTSILKSVSCATHVLMGF